MIKVMFAMLILAVSSLGHAKDPTISKSAIYISGTIGSNMKSLSEVVLKKQIKGAKVIDIVLDSPGGSVYSGMQFINAMEMVKVRGTKIRCFVTTLAASMAFQILAHCDERFAFPYSLLLWHPPSINMSSRVTPARAEYIRTELQYISDELTTKLRSELGISDKLFFHHYHRETLFTGKRLNKIADDFIVIVHNINGLKRFKKPVGLTIFVFFPKNEFWYQYSTE